MKDPYVYENTNILKNLSGIKQQETLNNYETTMVNLGIINLLKSNIIISKVNDIFNIHKVLFENVYEWAGQARTINIFKEEPILNNLSVQYSDYKIIKKELTKIQDYIDSLNWNKFNVQEKVKYTVKIISSIWQVHAFREGNTRVISMFLYFFMKNIGLFINKDFISKHAKYFRNALVLASIGEYSEYIYLENILLDSISEKDINIKYDKKYQTIKGYNLEQYEYNYHSKKEK